MEEKSFSPEVQEMLPKATKEVGRLYLGDQLANLLRTQSPEQRDQLWSKTAQEFGPFSEKIRGLREALKNADITKKAYPEGIANVMRLDFYGVEDKVAAELLTDLFFARTITSPGYMDYDMDMVKEAEAIAQELGASGGISGEKMKSIGLDTVIESVLTGNLKVTRQTQLSKQE